MKTITAALLTTLAGFSTGLGGLIVLFIGMPTLHLLGVLLSFACGVMLYISSFDLYMDAMATVGFRYANLSMFLGMVFFFALTSFMPMIERAMSPIMAAHRRGARYTKKEREDESLWSTGIITLVSICMHNLPEGVAVYLTSLKGAHVGLPLLFAVVLHNIPEGMAVSVPLYYSTGSRWYAFRYTLLSGLCEPLGALVLGYMVDLPGSDEFVVECMLAAAAGIMIALTVLELVPAALKHVSHGVFGLAMMGGMLLVFLGEELLRDVEGGEIYTN